MSGVAGILLPPSLSPCDAPGMKSIPPHFPSRARIPLFSALWACALVAGVSVVRADGLASLGYRLIAESEAVVERIEKEFPHCYDTGAGIRDVESERYESRRAARAKALAAWAAHPGEDPAERARQKDIWLWYNQLHHAIDQRREGADGWESYRLDVEDIYYLDHALHALFPPADKADAWRRVRDATGSFRGEIPFVFTNGIATLEVPRGQVRPEWRCPDFDPYALFFRTEPDWCLAATPEAVLFVYEEDFERCITMHDWKLGHLAVLRGGSVVFDAVCQDEGCFADGFSWDEDGTLHLPPEVRDALARHGFSDPIHLPPSLR